MPDPDFIVSPTPPPIRVAVEPAHNGLNSLVLLYKADHASGFAEWVTRTMVALTPEQQHTNRLVVSGLHFATVPDRSWPSFPAYVDHLAAVDPTRLRDRVFNAYAQICLDKKDHCLPADPTMKHSLDIGPLLESRDAFLDFLGQRFPEDHIDFQIEAEAHEYLNDPPAMQALIVSHFREMWQEVLAPEWERALPMIETSVEAFRQVDLTGLTKFEALELVAGQEFDPAWKLKLDQVERVVFVPSTHVGPYLTSFRAGSTVWLLFGARIPEGVQVHAPDLSRAELLVRINALADDTRLRILRLVEEEGEKRSQDIMARLDLSQSAASRHLKQLAATGYLHERRCNGAKCYKLNPRRVEGTLRALSAFLLGSQPTTGGY